MMTCGKEREDLMMAILPACHHPQVVLADPFLWTRLVNRVKLDSKEFMVKRKTDIVSVVEVMMSRDPSMGKGIIKTVINTSPDVVVPFIINNIETVLTNQELLSVTAEEYQISSPRLGRCMTKLLS